MIFNFFLLLFQISLMPDFSFSVNCVFRLESFRMPEGYKICIRFSEIISIGWKTRTSKFSDRFPHPPEAIEKTGLDKIPNI